jgi:hypothetical protein
LQPVRIHFPTFTREPKYDGRSRKFAQRDLLGVDDELITTFRVEGGHKIKTPSPTAAHSTSPPPVLGTDSGGPGVALAPDYINPCYRTWTNVPPAHVPITTPWIM